MATRLAGVSRANLMISSALKPSLATNDTLLSPWRLSAATFRSRYSKASCLDHGQQSFEMDGIIEPFPCAIGAVGDCVGAHEDHFEIELLRRLVTAGSTASASSEPSNGTTIDVNGVSPWYDRLGRFDQQHGFTVARKTFSAMLPRRKRLVPTAREWPFDERVLVGGRGLDDGFSGLPPDRGRHLHTHRVLATVSRYSAVRRDWSSTNGRETTLRRPTYAGDFAQIGDAEQITGIARRRAKERTTAARIPLPVSHREEQQYFYTYIVMSPATRVTSRASLTPARRCGARHFR